MIFKKLNLQYIYILSIHTQVTIFLKMAKTRCTCCLITNCLKMDCKYCLLKFCTFCLMPEKHNCDNITECKKRLRDKLSDELMGNKCIKAKLESI